MRTACSRVTTTKAPSEGLLCDRPVTQKSVVLSLPQVQSFKLRLERNAWQRCATLLLGRGLYSPIKAHKVQKIYTECECEHTVVGLTPNPQRFTPRRRKCYRRLGLEERSQMVFKVIACEGPHLANDTSCETFASNGKHPTPPYC